MPEPTFAESLSFSLRQASSEAEFLRQIPWRDDADADLVDAAREGNLKAFWEALGRECFGLGSRANRSKVHERREAVAMSLWGITEETPLVGTWKELALRLEAARESGTEHRAKKKQKSAREEQNGRVVLAEIKVPRKHLATLTDWVEAAKNQAPTADEALILAELLRMAGPLLPAKLGVSLWRCLLLAALDWPLTAEHHAVNTGEVPFVLGLFFADVKGMDQLRDLGRETLRVLLEEHTDTDGSLRADTLEQAASWLPPFVRAAEWGHAAELPWWNEAGGQRFQHLAGRLAGCLAGDGHLAFDRAKSAHVLPMLLACGRLAGGSKKDWPLNFLMDVARPSKKHSVKLKASRRRAAEANTDAIVHQSDWGKTACLRNHDGPGANVFALTHHQPLPQIDFSPFGQLFFQGPWELEVSLDNQPVKLPDEWACVCWHTDSDGDYLELQFTLDENLRIERQVFLSRADHFLFMADCISGAGKSAIHYIGRWPLIEGAKVQRNNWSRERTVSLGNLSVRSFPLALPMEIVHSTSGRWDVADGAKKSCLELRQTGVGGLYAPVIFDWTPARQSSDADWKTLTVTENGPKVKTDRASGHRLRLGNQQLLIYRSLLLNGELRTVLGHHTGYETVIGRFDKSGDVTPLLVVE
jgi:hypothetical protein